MNNTLYDHRLENLPASIWEKITQIDELKGCWVGRVRLGPQVLGRLKQSVLITSCAGYFTHPFEFLANGDARRKQPENHRKT